MSFFRPGLETRVNTTIAANQQQPAVAALSNGGYIVTWISADGGGYYTGVGLIDRGIYAQRYDADGKAVGSQTRVNTTVAGDQHQPAVAALSNGSYVVTWLSNGTLNAQRYDATGNAVGSETRVTNSIASAAVDALADGGYVVTWIKQNGDGSAIAAQRYDAAGNAVGSVTYAKTTALGQQSDLTVAALSDGGYVVTWGSLGYNFSGSAIYAQRYDAAGKAVGGEASTAGGQYPAVAALSDGGYVVTWRSFGQDGCGHLCPAL